MTCTISIKFADVADCNINADNLEQGINIALEEQFNFFGDDTIPNLVDLLDNKNLQKLLGVKYTTSEQVLRRLIFEKINTKKKLEEFLKILWSMNEDEICLTYNC